MERDLHSELSVLQDMVSALIGQSAWAVRQGTESIFALEFGNKILIEGNEEVYGEWRLMTRACSWRLDSLNEMIVGSADAPDYIARQIKQIEHNPIMSFQVHPPALETEIVFKSGLTLYFFPVASVGYEHWKLVVRSDCFCRGWPMCHPAFRVPRVVAPTPKPKRSDH